MKSVVSFSHPGRKKRPRAAKETAPAPAEPASG